MLLDLSYAHCWDITAIDALDRVVHKFRRNGIGVNVHWLNRASATWSNSSGRATSPVAPTHLSEVISRDPRPACMLRSAPRTSSAASSRQNDAENRERASTQLLSWLTRLPSTDPPWADLPGTTGTYILTVRVVYQRSVAAAAPRVKSLLTVSRRHRPCNARSAPVRSPKLSERKHAALPSRVSGETFHADHHSSSRTPGTAAARLSKVCIGACPACLARARCRQSAKSVV